MLRLSHLGEVTMRKNAVALDYLSKHADFFVADLYTITLATDANDPLRWTDGDTDLTVGGHTFTAGGSSGAPLISRGTLRWAAGLEVSDLEVTLGVGPGVLLHSRPLALGAAEGMFYGAHVLIERLFMPAWGDVSLGTIWWFEGNVAEAICSASEVKLTVKSELESLNVAMPKRLFEPGCPHTFCSSACGLSALSHTASATVQAASTTSVQLSAANASGYYALGVLTFKSGTCSGLSRTIVSDSGSALTVSPPLPRTPAAGDAVSVMRGCAKTLAACKAYGNQGHFAGFPWVPKPEDVR